MTPPPRKPRIVSNPNPVSAPIYSPQNSGSSYMCRLSCKGKFLVFRVPAIIESNGEGTVAVRTRLEKGSALKDFKTNCKTGFFFSAEGVGRAQDLQIKLGRSAESAPGSNETDNDESFGFISPEVGPDENVVYTHGDFGVQCKMQKKDQPEWDEIAFLIKELRGHHFRKEKIDEQEYAKKVESPRFFRKKRETPEAQSVQ